MQILLVGCGGVGSAMARQLARRRPDIRFVAADYRIEAARQLADVIGGQATPIALDVHDRAALDAALDEADLVFNAAGPFYKNAFAVIDAAILAGVDYIDINDDHDVADKLFLNSDVDRRAREAGVRLMIGCGSTPGLTNVMARLLSDRLDRPRAVHLATVVPFSPALFSPAVLDHMFHITSGEVVQFLGGEYRMMPGWGGRREFSFAPPFRTYPAFFIGHGETVTLPHFIKGLEDVTNRIGFFPEAASEVWRSLIRFGLGNAKPIEALGISPLQFLSAHLATPDGAEAIGVPVDGEPWGAAFRVEVEGERGRDRVTSVIELHHFIPTEETDVADPTPICARIAVEAWLDGKVSGEGLLAPEACLDPERYVRDFAEQSGARLIQTETVVTEDAYAA